MSLVSPDTALPLHPGQPVNHPELGEGVVIGLEPTGFVRVFFRVTGERQVDPRSLRHTRPWEEGVVASARPATPATLERLWLAVEAAELPLLDAAATLTSAKVELLPHQVVLVHRISRTQPRRFLIADEVGLGKTIETALILRELASRGELRRAMMVVPAGLVENWRRELNDVFNLDFEVFGSEGDITDRKTNAFAKHHRIIISVDTLKKPARIKRLKDAPPWDLVVFDEAHHLSAYRTGKRVRKTENFKLAEAIREHTRDMLLLSATPHQGDHFRFWMLARLLDPALFTDERDMVQNRHRLNAVVIRRTKADACRPDGSPLFARRVVHTQAFTLGLDEKTFYNALLDYLRDGYNQAQAQGSQGRALGFVMTIFQKIAASSFAAVRVTLQRRLLMLTIREAIESDERLDVEGRDRALQAARDLVTEMHNLSADAIGRAQAERMVADAKVQLLKRMGAEIEEGHDDSEAFAAYDEDVAVTAISLALPKERGRIRELLAQFPAPPETKTQELINALRQLWAVNPSEKVVVFTTYLGSIDSLHAAIDVEFPDKGVEVLKGGDHGAKTAALKRFQRKDGPRVLLSTAAGREGINLQFARVLFNYDLPWNPMDLEQRIGRIHRYGQKDTAQVYNLVASDTIEGEIFLLLEKKLQDIAEALGKVDENGQLAEDLRSQILGQLNTQLSYQKLYQEAISDPALRRTRQEIAVALDNANQARQVVFELFQDLERFNLSDYQQFDDGGESMARLVAFVQRAAHVAGGDFVAISPNRFDLLLPNQLAVNFTTDRDTALENDSLQLLGLEHPLVKRWLDDYQNLPPEERGIRAHIDDNREGAGLATIWQVTLYGSNNQIQQRVLRIGVNASGERSPYFESLVKDLFRLVPAVADTFLPTEQSLQWVTTIIPQFIHRELNFMGLLPEGFTYQPRLLAYVEMDGGNGHQPRPGREFGSGRHLIIAIAPDFDEPLDDLSDYSNP